ncbi:MAG: hypothetical protein E7Z65_08490 [Thermoplasmata archaeon]|nr:hypothetical protein [Thermoplasmata archaeon]
MDEECPEGADMGNNVNQMKMPTSYLDMDSAEIQYKGGFSWVKALFIVAAVGAVIAVSGLAVGAVGVSWGGALASGAELATGRAIVGVGLSMLVGGGFLGVTAGGGAMIAQGPGRSD